MKFEKYVFGLALNGWSVAKYTSGEEIRIVAEHSDYANDGEKTFPNENEYICWIDGIVDDETATYNKALAVKLVLDALRKMF